ncbi:unnamed protein product [Penicillium olsonii]|uniref:Uncharacterized protein n=1 Tax=Penicillium olsonii TaxID=99116 RepID=A0A9W4HD50_PENOL|nr:unnamed protein product [Penicillium olsonii]
MRNTGPPKLKRLKSTANLQKGEALQAAADTCIIHIQVPRPFINNLRMENLGYSPNWKEYIWTCRRQATPHPRFDHLWRSGQADIVRGPICSTLSTQLVRIRTENIQSHITEDNVMQLLSGRKATQWVFVQRDGVDRLAEHIRGKMHFIIFEAAVMSQSYQEKGCVDSNY